MVYCATGLVHALNINRITSECTSERWMVGCENNAHNGQYVLLWQGLIRISSDNRLEILRLVVELGMCFVQILLAFLNNSL